MLLAARLGIWGQRRQISRAFPQRQGGRIGRHAEDQRRARLLSGHLKQPQLQQLRVPLDHLCGIGQVPERGGFAPRALERRHPFLRACCISVYKASAKLSAFITATRGSAIR